MSQSGVRRSSWRKRVAIALLAVLLLAFGWLGPSTLLDDGTAPYHGDAYDRAVAGLADASLLLDNPIERGFVRKLRVQRVIPTPSSVRDPHGLLCNYWVVVDAYGPFFFPYSDIVVTCGEQIRTR